MTNRSVTRIAICLDSSSSMGSIHRNVIGAFNGIVENIKSHAVQGSHSFTSLFKFGSSVSTIYKDRKASALPSICNAVYHPSGNTALNDAIVFAVWHLHSSLDVMNENEACLVVVVTDGEENNSLYTHAQVADLIGRMQKSGKWTFVFQVPPGAREMVARQYAVPLDNVKEWEASAHGVEEMGRSTTQGLTTYFNARSTGAHSVEKFFVTADLSKVSEEDVKAMPDLSRQFRSLKVDKEVAVREFCEAVTNKPYVIGSAYYQLSKKETVQATKNILVRKRGEKKVYGGKDGRRLLGLPSNASAVVDVGNLSDFEVFVQSTSVNRKLVRGTVVLFDTALVKGLEPTWDHVSAEKAAAEAAQSSSVLPVQVEPRKRVKKAVKQVKAARVLRRDGSGRFVSHA